MTNNKPKTTPKPLDISKRYMYDNGEPREYRWADEIRSALDGAEDDLHNEMKKAVVKNSVEMRTGISMAVAIYRKWFKALYEKEWVD